MARKDRPVITTALLLQAYANGYFPMADEEHRIQWHNPDPRAIIPLDQLKANARLARFLRNNEYRCTINTCFERVIRACADRPSTWINEEIIQLYIELHHTGHAISAETWKDDELIGGLYGVTIGSAFFGESMFSARTNGSRAALHHLAAYLRKAGYRLFDTQYVNDHTRSLGAIEIPRAEYHQLLVEAINVEPTH